jgi:nucleoside-diphosphate-sugar epimerase
MTRRVLVTGATGFVGRTLCETLLRRDIRVRAAVRDARVDLGNPVEICQVGEIGRGTDWGRALDDVDCVMHLAARAHATGRRAGSQSALFQEVNAAGTARLVDAAVRGGVARFIYLSSVKVNGEATTGRPYSAHDEPKPTDAYARSKWQGELAVHDPALSARMGCATLRAPLVYGPGVRANFLRLMRWVDRGTVLPFGAVRNLRSLISVWNLADALIRVAEHQAAPGRIWMVSDGEDVSTPDLIRALGRAMGRQVRMVSVPLALLRLAGALTAHGAEVAKLCGSLVVDATETRSILQWTPPLTLPQGLDRTVAWYQGRSDAAVT